MEPASNSTSSSSESSDSSSLSSLPSFPSQSEANILEEPDKSKGRKRAGGPKQKARPKKQAKQPNPDHDISEEEECVGCPGTGASGPKTLEEAFGWPQYNAQILLAENSAKKHFEDLATNFRLEIQESFAGTCGGSISLKQQFRAFAAQCGLPLANVSEAVVTRTVSECNSTAQSYIIGLNEASGSSFLAWSTCWERCWACFVVCVGSIAKVCLC